MNTYLLLSQLYTTTNDVSYRVMTDHYIPAGEVQLEDPRLGNLPLDLGFYVDVWRKRGFQRIKISVDVLREARVPVRYFDLV